MKFLHQKFQAKKREIVEVGLDKPARVKFMTASEFRLYKMGKTHTYYGGRFEENPVRFVLPFDSVWNVVVEKGTHSAPIEVKASCKLRGPDRQLLSSIAVDAPAHVTQALLEESEAEALNMGSQSES